MALAVSSVRGFATGAQARLSARKAQRVVCVRASADQKALKVRAGAHWGQGGFNSGSVPSC